MNINMYKLTIKSYNVSIHTPVNTQEVFFISDPQGRLGIGKWLLATGRVNNRVALKIGDKIL